MKSKNLIVLVGVRGAGKTTILSRLRSSVYVLKPVTTRPPRGELDFEYDFVGEEEWDDSQMAWQISVGRHRYGVRRKSLELPPGCSEAFTVFDPGSIDVLYEVAPSLPLQLYTIGLDTVNDIDEQRARVRGDAGRSMIKSEFERQTARVKMCDVVLAGDVEVVLNAVIAVSVLTSNAGVVDKEAISALIAAGALLRNASDSQVQPASYDLRLGKKAMRDGIKDISQEPLSIPPYEYAVVMAEELAAMPSFIVGNFDLRVSMFVKGLILSNGPQVDPGYHGALACLLYNCSNRPYVLECGEHFATIQFATTVRPTAGYRERYQQKREFMDFADGGTRAPSGASLVQRVALLEGESKGLLNARVSSSLAIVSTLGLVVTLAITVWLAFKPSNDSTSRPQSPVTYGVSDAGR